MQRYFANLEGEYVNLDEGDVHHLLHVMRARIGDQIEVVTSQKLFHARVENLSPLSIKIFDSIEQKSELPFDVTLIFPLAKGDKIELVLQKATELGVKNIYLVNTRYCVVKIDQPSFEKKKERYLKILKEASEQAHRLVIPNLYGVVDIDALPSSTLSKQNFVAYEKLSESGDIFPFSESKSSITYFVGPEGGFSEEEINALIKRGFAPISLGGRILRCETAAIYGLSVIGYYLEK
ncbi:MAG: RsmE family RNA methyltransferase [Bacilli bacterium]|jgi:16S rRNA (uracil1498-N3)-methyltransferase|nr:RsmE family RNA methyltransferase [Bacilli bacterium]